MIYELTIAFTSIVISFVIYFGFFKFFQNHRHPNDGSDDEVVFDERADLDGKELVLVNVVRHKMITNNLQNISMSIEFNISN